jgi:hypothetical protein
LRLSSRPFKFSIVCLLFLLACPLLTLFTVDSAAAQSSDEYYNKTFEWDYSGKHWTWNLSIPKALYDEYRSVPVSTRVRDGPAGYGFCTTTRDPYIQSLATELNKTTNSLGYSSYDQVSFVLAFVQSLPYTSDNVTEGYNEYPRFPIETLVDDGGDCEDTSILFAALTLNLGYGTVFLNPPNHYAVGILGNDLKGVYFTYNNKTYYYCETTGNNFKIGDLPEEFSGQSAYVYPIYESTQYVASFSAVPVVQPTEPGAPLNTTPAPTQQPNTTPSPTVGQPTIEPVRPLSFNLITDQPVLFVIIVFAIILSITLAIWSVRRPRLAPSTSPTAIPTIEDNNDEPPASEAAEDVKYCIYCGSPNKAYAAYCERCGKQIA